MSVGHVPSANNEPRQLKEIQRPTYAQGLLWSDTGPEVTTVADSTLYHPPLPDVPDMERNDPVLNATLQRHPELFRIVTPINVDRFEELLIDHPNRPFVDSVLRGLREGFWPWAEKPEDYPVTWDEAKPTPSDELVSAFLREQCAEEVAAERFSEPFGTDLLPGMYYMPIHAVPKPHSSKMRLVTNHSAGAYSLNSMISRESISGVILDGIPALGQGLRKIRQEHKRPLMMWKSDVSHAYQLMPMSPYWQLKQVITVDGLCRIGRCNVFGNRGSQRIWNAFISLVIWIAIQMYFMMLLGYVDDNFGAEEEGQLEFYEPYGYYYPRSQTRLLQLWDELGIPHEFKKQLYGPIIPIIGFDVDPNRMLVTLNEEGRTSMLQSIKDFCGGPQGGRRRTLREFLSLTGYINWAFNVYPLLKPALSNLYAKTAGKDKMNAKIYVNQKIADDLTWLSEHVRGSDGVHFFDAVKWGISDLSQSKTSDEIAYVDVSGKGLGLYFPWMNCAYFADVPPEAPDGIIFFTEALAACAAIHKIRDFWRARCTVLRLGIYSDNLNSVHIFNSLRAKPTYNEILKSAVNVRLELGLDVRVQHIPGVENEVADAISHQDFRRARQLHPSLNILPFIPPRDALGACKK